MCSVWLFVPHERGQNSFINEIYVTPLLEREKVYRDTGTKE